MSALRVGASRNYKRDLKENARRLFGYRQSTEYFCKHSRRQEKQKRCVSRAIRFGRYIWRAEHTKGDLEEKGGGAVFLRQQGG